MPQLGETVTEGTITKWVKKIGDKVDADETLFEVSTDKVDSEVPSPTSGVLIEILVNEGDVAEVGAKLAVISEGDAAGAPEIAGASSPLLSVSDPEAPATIRSENDAPAAPAAPAVPAPAPATPVPAPVTPAPAPASSTPAAVAQSTKGKLISPLVRKLIKDNNLDANNIIGTGAGGRITREDVNKALAGAAGTQVPERASAGPTGAETESAGASVPAFEQAQVTRPASGDEIIPFDNMRRRTAEHMVMSRATSAHAYMSVEVDFENVESVRRKHGKAFKEREGFSLTYLPFIVRALSEVLPEFPNVNASVDGDSLVVHHDFHVGIAVDLDNKGLLVPALRNADGKRLRLLAQEIRDLAVRARERQLKPDEVIGSTFTISNPGPYGSYQTFPIINQPQVAILATDGVTKKPVVIQDEFGIDTIAIHHTGMLTLGWDHRAFDGGYTAQFLSRLKEVLEERDWESELV